MPSNTIIQRSPRFSLGNGISDIVRCATEPVAKDEFKEWCCYVESNEVYLIGVIVKKGHEK